MFDLALPLAKIIGVNLVLSGDNAIVIAMACRELSPAHRRVGIIGGAAGAVLARIVLLGVAGAAFTLPGVKIIGALFLLWVAIKMIREAEDGEHKTGESLREAIAIIVIADVMMSADNVIAITAAAGSNFWLAAFGVAISAPIIMFGAEILSKALEKFPALIWAGAILLLYIAGETALADPLIERLGH